MSNILEVNWNIAVISVFLSYILIDVFDIGYRIKKLLKRNEFEVMKPFDCPVCMSFWICVILTTIFLQAIATPMAAFLLTKIIDKNGK